MTADKVLTVDEKWTVALGSFRESLTSAPDSTIQMLRDTFAQASVKHAGEIPNTWYLDAMATVHEECKRRGLTDAIGS